MARGDVLVRRLLGVVAIIAQLLLPVAAAAASAPFTDVSGTLAEEIYRAYEAGLVDGYGNGKFRPNENVSRAAFAKMIVLAVERATGKSLPTGSEPFSDVYPGQALYTYVVKAYGAGFIKGYSSSIFGYDKPISRMEAAAILQRALKLPPRAEYFEDVPDYSSFAQQIGAVAAAGIMQGYGETFKPNQLLPRAQAAAIAYRAYRMLREGPPLGSQQNPVPLGKEVPIGNEWRVTVLEVIPDAWPILKDYSSINNPPDPGMQYVMARLRITYVGKERWDAPIPLTARYIDANNVIAEAWCTYRVPDEWIWDWWYYFEPGTAVELNKCWSVPSSTVRGGWITFDHHEAPNETRTFFQGVK